MKSCGHLALSERVIQRVVDHLRQNAEPRGLVAVDRDGGGGSADLLIGGDVAQHRHYFDSLSENFRSPVVRSSLEIGVLLACIGIRSWKCAAPTRTSGIACMRQLAALDLRQFRPVAGDVSLDVAARRAHPRFSKR